jgi:hypothetical protein
MQRGVCPRETVETALGGRCLALGRGPLPRRIQRVESRVVTPSGETSHVLLVRALAPAPASAHDGGPDRHPNARALSLSPWAKHARNLHGGSSSVFGKRRRAAVRQIPCASTVPVLEGLPLLRDDRLPTQRFRHVRCHQNIEAGVHPGILSVLAVPSSPNHVWWCSVPSLLPCLLGERASSVSSWQRQTGPLRRRYAVV